MKYINKRFIVLSVLILFLGGVLRFWHVPERLVFSGETNNVLYAVSDFLGGTRSPLLGLEATGYAHHLFFTPWYLYLVAGILHLVNGEPLLLAYVHVFAGLLTVFTLILIGRAVSRPNMGLIAAFIWAVSEKLISFDRSVWAVGLVPFVSAIAILLLIQSLKKKTGQWFVALGIWLGFGLSLHFQMILLVVAFLVIIFRKRPNFLGHFLVPIALSFLPLFIFDLRHNFFNLSGIFLVAQTVLTGGSPYSSAHYFLVFYIPIVLAVGLVTSNFNKIPLLLLLGSYSLLQLQIFSKLPESKSYIRTESVVREILVNYIKGDEIFFKDRDSYDYKYLLFLRAKTKGIDPKTFVIYEPWQQANSARIVVESNKVSYRNL